MSVELPPPCIEARMIPVHREGAAILGTGEMTEATPYNILVGECRCGAVSQGDSAEDAQEATAEACQLMKAWGHTPHRESTVP